MTRNGLTFLNVLLSSDRQSLRDLMPLGDVSGKPTAVLVNLRCLRGLIFRSYKVGLVKPLNVNILLISPPFSYD